MRVVHLTDLHVQVAPRASELFGKRLLSTANLYLLGRSAKFSADAQRAAVATGVAAAPDLVIIPGDLPAPALSS